MIVILALLAAAAVSAMVTPWLLTRGHWASRLPRFALGLWHGALAFGAVCILAAGITAIITTMRASDENAATLIAVSVVAWSLLLAGGALLALLLAGVERDRGSGDSPRRMIETIPHEVEVLADGTALWVCDDDAAFACALPGTTPAIVVTRGLRSLLTQTQLAAVLAHERAHLRYRHHLALSIARLHRDALPHTRGSRDLVRATRLLIELIADDSAARTVGAVHLANALVRMEAATGDATLAARADRLATRRWRAPRQAGRAAAPAAASTST